MPIKVRRTCISIFLESHTL